MTTVFNINTAVNGALGFGLPFCDTIYTATLAASTEKTITVPGAGSDTSRQINKYIAVFSYEDAKNVYVALNATAAVPAGSSFAASTSELNPPAKYVKAGDVLHLITADTDVDVSVAIYQLL